MWNKTWRGTAGRELRGDENVGLKWMADESGLLLKEGIAKTGGAADLLRCHKL